jgi:hypothetical protein
MTSAASPLPSRLFYVQDHNSGTQFLVDTGSEDCVIPPPPTDRQRINDAITHTTVNNTHIPTFRKQSLTLNLGLCGVFQWVLIITDIRNPILGADTSVYLSI